MASWMSQIEKLIAPAVRASKVTQAVQIDRGVIGNTGPLAAGLTPHRRAVLFADSAGFAAAGAPVRDGLTNAGFHVETQVLPADPLPEAAVEQAIPFVQTLTADPDAFPVSVGSGVINDLVKYAAFRTDRRYLSVATAASMDGYTSAGAPLAEGGFKVTIPARAPIALIADLDVIAKAPREMTGWGYGDLAGKSPAGGDWILADLVGAEAIDDRAWPLVQDNLHGWLADPQHLMARDFDAMARLFIGLTAVGFAMEFHATSRPASGADHQIAHMWEMEGLRHGGRKVSHGAAVAVGTTVTLGLFDWLLAQDLTRLDVDQLTHTFPDLATQQAKVDEVIDHPQIAARAKVETAAKWVDRDVLKTRLTRVKRDWPRVQNRLRRHLFRQDTMIDMLRQAGAPTAPDDIGVSASHMMRTVRTAAFIRSRYTVLDFLKEVGLFDQAVAHVVGRLTAAPVNGAAE